MSWLTKITGLDKSRKSGTGIYSWGKTDWVENAVGAIPGVGSALNMGLDMLSDSSDKAKKAQQVKSRTGSWIHVE